MTTRADGSSDAVWTNVNEAAGKIAIPGYLAGTPVAVLAGFALASAIFILGTRPNPDHWPDLASASCGALLLASAFFLVTLALAGRAEFVTLSPDQAETWWPELALDKASLEVVRDRVWHSQAETEKRIDQAVKSWIVGLVFFVGGSVLGVLSYDTTTAHGLLVIPFVVVSLFAGIIFLRDDSLAENRYSWHAWPLSKRAQELMLADKSRMSRPLLKFGDGHLLFRRPPHPCTRV